MNAKSECEEEMLIEHYSLTRQNSLEQFSNSSKKQKSSGNKYESDVEEIYFTKKNKNTLRVNLSKD